MAGGERRANRPRDGGLSHDAKTELPKRKCERLQLAGMSQRSARINSATRPAAFIDKALAYGRWANQRAGCGASALTRRWGKKKQQMRNVQKQQFLASEVRW